MARIMSKSMENLMKPAKKLVSDSKNTKSNSTQDLLLDFQKLSLSSSEKDCSKWTSISDFQKHILDKSTKNIVAIVGAGISTPSGIPDFRTPGTGLYDNLQKYDIPYPEAIFELRYFKKHPKPFFTLAKELYPGGKYKPSIVHNFLRLLHDKGKLLKVFTQNIDGLERAAGLPNEKLLEAHGTFSTATCLKCRRKYKDTDIKDKIYNDIIPKCEKPKCKGVVKPDIVFFGEQLPDDFWHYELIVPQADLIIVMGTSLEVYPFAGIVDCHQTGTPRLLINNEIVGSFRHEGCSDYCLIGDISDGINQLVDSLGWQDELTKMKH